MTKFNVGDKVRILDASKIISAIKGGFKTGDVYPVTQINNSGRPVIEHETNQLGFYEHELKYIQIVSDKPTKKQRITTLENELAETKNEVAELKLIVHELCERPQLTTVVNNVTQEPSTTNTVEDIIEFEGWQYRKVDREARKGDVVIFTKIPRGDRTTKDVQDNKPYKVLLGYEGETVIKDDDGSMLRVYGGGVLEGTPETVDVYELIESKPLTPNQQRAAIIEKAKKFVEENVANGRTSNRITEKGNSTYRDNYYDVDFFVKEGKVTAVVYWLVCNKRRIDKPSNVGRAICTQNDVFNEHIGKAIALGRALGLDVSEFEQAVQPTEVVVGMAIKACDYKFEEFEYTNVTKIENGKIHGIDSRFGSDSFVLIDAVERYGEWAKHTITNDTNAKYEEGQ
ncbi:hypothetical protein [Lysinibacillus sp. FSL W8-0992]|uniref:hypothetical protein n=1 Tax=Lysinibacillus sp. FSL W8-0992 TaxID=2954643 RepID=UPI0030FBFB41